MGRFTTTAKMISQHFALVFLLILAGQDPSLAQVGTEPTEQNPAADLEHYNDADAYQVYGSLLQFFIDRWEYGPNEIALIQAETEINVDRLECLTESDELPVKYRHLAKSFSEAIKTPLLIEQRIPIEQPHEFMAGDKLWEERKQKFSEVGPYFWGYFGYRGYTEVSAVAFDIERKHALVYAAFDCGGQCGDMGYYLLEEQDGKWVIILDGFCGGVM